jgi:hypothetical protein
MRWVAWLLRLTPALTLAGCGSAAPMSGSCLAVFDNGAALLGRRSAVLRTVNGYQAKSAALFARAAKIAKALGAA